MVEAPTCLRVGGMYPKTQNKQHKACTEHQAHGMACIGTSRDRDRELRSRFGAGSEPLQSTHMTYDGTCSRPHRHHSLGIGNIPNIQGAWCDERILSAGRAIIDWQPQLAESLWASIRDNDLLGTTVCALASLYSCHFVVVPRSYDGSRGHRRTTSTARWTVPLS